MISLFLFPEGIFFLPLIAYEVPVHLLALLLTVAGGSMFWLLALPACDVDGLLFLLIGCLFAHLLRFRRDANEALLLQYRRTRDDDTELQLLLEERNRNLLEKQNREIYTATLRERNRIAREIHDNVGHMLTRSILMVGALHAVSKEAALKAPLIQLSDTLNQAMNRIRQSVHDLHDSSVNLQEALEALIHDFTFCPVTLHYAMTENLPRELKYSLISITKEGLVNIAKHSDASKASITAVEHPGFYQFILEDNGAGSRSLEEPFADSAQSLSGIGLTNMRTRINALHGTFRIHTENGFRIHITVPKEA